jgi:hypothetical protein
MVSDVMAKIVFLSVPVLAGFFPLRKGVFPIFFKVKQFFLRIKLWLARAGRIQRGKDNSKHEKA